MRVYTPTVDGGRRCRPLVFFHGGAFVLGDSYTEEHRCLRYAAEAGCVVVSVDYRLAPEHPFPAGVEDCYAALEWTVANAGELGIDPRRVAVGGSERRWGARRGRRPDGTRPGGPAAGGADPRSTR